MGVEAEQVSDGLAGGNSQGAGEEGHLLVNVDFDAEVLGPGCQVVLLGGGLGAEARQGRVVAVS